MLTYTVETDALTIVKADRCMHGEEHPSGHSVLRERVRITDKSIPAGCVEFDATHIPELIAALQEIEPAGTEEWHKLMRARKARTDGDG